MCAKNHLKFHEIKFKTINKQIGAPMTIKCIDDVPKCVAPLRSSKKLWCFVEHYSNGVQSKAFECISRTLYIREYPVCHIYTYKPYSFF